MSDTLASYLKRILAERGWSGRTLAENAGLGVNTVAKAVRGDSVPEPETIRRIARSLSVDETFLLRLAGHIESIPLDHLHPTAVYIAQRLTLLPVNLRDEAIEAVSGVVDSYWNLSEKITVDSDQEVQVLNGDEDVPLEILRELKERDPETYYAFLEDRLGPNWRAIVEDFVSIQPVLDTLDEVDQAPSTEQPVSTRRQRG